MEDQPLAQEVQTTELRKGKLVISLTAPTPVWVTWIFRTEFVLNKAVMIWLSATTLVPPENLKETILTLTIVDFIVWGLGRFIGISKEEIADE